MNGGSNQPRWKVLLIGGSSGVGKSIVTPQIARYFAAPCSQIDDFRLVLQRITTPDQQPTLHFFVGTEQVWHRSPEELCERLIEVGRVVSRNIEIVIAHHVATNTPLVLEGDGIMPALGAQCSFAGLETGDDVRSVFIFEPDEEILFTNMQGRGRGFQQHSMDEQRTQARLNWLYGKWLRQEAARYGLPVILSRPWNSLAERVIAAIE